MFRKTEHWEYGLKRQWKSNHDNNKTPASIISDITSSLYDTKVYIIHYVNNEIV